jgi:hypothetical protein
MTFAHDRPPKKNLGIAWPIAIAALMGLGFGLQNLWRDLFAPDPRASDSYLSISYVLDGVTVMTCGLAIFLLVKAAGHGKS